MCIASLLLDITMCLASKFLQHRRRRHHHQQQYGHLHHHRHHCHHWVCVIKRHKHWKLSLSKVAVPHEFHVVSRTRSLVIQITTTGISTIVHDRAFFAETTDSIWIKPSSNSKPIDFHCGIQVLILIFTLIVLVLWEAVHHLYRLKTQIKLLKWTPLPHQLYNRYDYADKLWSLSISCFNPWLLPAPDKAQRAKWLWTNMLTSFVASHRYANPRLFMSI